MVPLHSNHNHTHPPSASASGSDSASNQNTSTIPSIYIRLGLDMPLPPNPPADPKSANGVGSNDEALSGANSVKCDNAGTHMANANGSPGVRKPGTSTFASVVSSFSSNMARSPLPSTSTAPNTHQQREQAQAQAQSASAAPEALSEFLGTNGDHIVIAQTTDAASAATSLPPTSVSDYIDAQDGDDVNHDHEDDDSSDIEIYLNTLGLHDSAARMHVLSSAGKCHFLLLDLFDVVAFDSELCSTLTFILQDAWSCLPSLF